MNAIQQKNKTVCVAAIYIQASFIAEVISVIMNTRFITQTKFLEYRFGKRLETWDFSRIKWA